MNNKVLTINGPLQKALKIGARYQLTQMLSLGKGQLSTLTGIREEFKAQGKDITEVEANIKATRAECDEINEVLEGLL